MAYENEIKNFRKIKTLIRKGWTQNASARNKDGRIVGATSDEAVCYCLIGATVRVAGVDADSLSRLFRRTHGMGMVRYNDHIAGTRADVLRAIDKVIAECQS